MRNYDELFKAAEFAIKAFIAFIAVIYLFIFIEMGKELNEIFFNPKTELSKRTAN